MAAMVILGVLALVVVWPVLAALAGALAGWVVGLFFADTILGLFAQLGIKNVEMWQIGMFLGFVGGFFRSHTSAGGKS